MLLELSLLHFSSCIILQSKLTDRIDDLFIYLFTKKTKQTLTGLKSCSCHAHETHKAVCVVYDQ